VHWLKRKEKLRKTQWTAHLEGSATDSNSIGWAFVAQVGCGCKGCQSSYAVYRRVMPLLSDSEVEQIKKNVREITRASHPAHSATIDGAV
jgi:hypothetical protein